MSIDFTCPGCGEVSVLKDRMAGKKYRCPECGQSSEVTVPSGQMFKFLVIGGIFVLGIAGVCVVMVLRHKLETAAAPPQMEQPKPSEPVTGKEEELIKRGNEALAKGDFDLAVSCGADAIQINPKNPEAYRLRAQALQGKKNYEQAQLD